MRRVSIRGIATAAAASFIASLGIACGPSSVEGDDDSGDDDAGSAIDASGAGAGDSDGAGDLGCTTLLATVRDFRRTHPDFETFNRDEIYTGIVESTLGSDGKPVYAHAGGTPHTSGPLAFQQWYRDVPGINQPIPVPIALTEASPGRFVFDSDAFFPVDGLGFGAEGFQHNYHFTTEIHTSFKYMGGEVFTFRGDDDLWMFINKKLAIDLGGLHQQEHQTVDLNTRAGELGLAPGQVYAMDIFHAERHTVSSTFHIETTIDCFIVD